MAGSTLGWRTWISGASSGIGEALARALAARECRLALFARREARLKAVRAEIEGLFPDSQILVHPGDVRDRECVGASVREAERVFGGLDVVVLNAGTGDSLFPDRFDATVVERITAINYLGAIYGIEAALPGMLERRAGKIVCISSISAVRGLPNAGPYCASKAALNTFVESLRVSLRGRGVQVLTVSPGFVKTPLTDRNQFPMPFRLPVEKAAKRIVAGIQRGKRDIHFPRRLTVPVRLLRYLPAGLYEWLMGFVAKRGYGKKI